jgi:hypothetical protein
MHRTIPRFWQCFDKLPEVIKNLAKSNFQRLRENPHHPSLHFKRIGQLWSVRIGLAHRALAVKDGSDYIWVWIGTHDEYKRLCREGR